MIPRLLLDEHLSARIAERLPHADVDVVAVVAESRLRGLPDAEIYRVAAGEGRRIVTENVKDYRPLLVAAYAREDPIAPLLLVASGRFPRRGARRESAIVAALEDWIHRPDAASRPDEDWLV